MAGTLFYYMYSVNDEHKLSISVLIPLGGLRPIDETIDFVINQKQGQGNTLNIGISLLDDELICLLDTDCMLDDNALMNIVKHFKDESVVAAGGRLSVIQRNRKLIVKTQNYEYLRAFQITKNIFATLNAQCMISGAFAMFRKSSLIEVNGYDTDTVGEDMEHVLKLQNSSLKRSKGRIIYEPEAVCYTGTPETLGRLLKQRDRWQRGILDCLIKHANMLFNSMFGFLGIFVLPYQLLLELLGPV